MHHSILSNALLYFFGSERFSSHLGRISGGPPKPPSSVKVKITFSQENDLLVT